MSTDVLSPEGAKYDRPGQRPGYASSTKCLPQPRRGEIERPYRERGAGLAIAPFPGFVKKVLSLVFPGRCPGLTHFAPSGLTRGAVAFITSLLVLLVVLVPVPTSGLLAGDDPPAQSEPPVRLRKKLRPAEPAAETKPETDEAKDKPAAKQSEPRQLRRPKDRDDDSEPVLPAADPREILNRVANNMRQVEERLGKHDPGAGTQQKQRDVVTDLDKLIEQTKQQQQQQQAGNNTAPQNMRRQQSRQPSARQQRQQEQQQEQSTRKNANQPGAGGQSKGSSRIADLYKDIWGHLPETMRQEMDAYSREQFMAKYNDLLKQYYSTLAEKRRRQDD